MSDTENEELEDVVPVTMRFSLLPLQVFASINV